MNAVDTNMAQSGGPLVAETSTALLRTLAEVLDIRSVFPRVSEIVKPVVPHDALVLVFLDRAGRVTLEARSNYLVPQMQDRVALGELYAVPKPREELVCGGQICVAEYRVKRREDS